VFCGLCLIAKHGLEPLLCTRLGPREPVWVQARTACSCIRLIRCPTTASFASIDFVRLNAGSVKFVALGRLGPMRYVSRRDIFSGYKSRGERNIKVDTFPCHSGWVTARAHACGAQGSSTMCSIHMHSGSCGVEVHLIRTRMLHARNSPRHHVLENQHSFAISLSSTSLRVARTSHTVVSHCRRRGEAQLASSNHGYRPYPQRYVGDKTAFASDVASASA
jgi:hypothetical protein